MPTVSPTSRFQRQLAAYATYALGLALACWGVYQWCWHERSNTGIQQILMGVALINGRYELTQLTQRLSAKD